MFQLIEKTKHFSEVSGLKLNRVKTDWGILLKRIFTGGEFLSSDMMNLRASVENTETSQRKQAAAEAQPRTDLSSLLKLCLI